MDPKRALLLVEHGSRQPAAHEQLCELAARIRERRPGWIVDVAHMEVVPPTVDEGVAACAAAGATEIIVVPYFLAPGLHTRETLPELVTSAASANPALTLRLANPLGLHDKIADVVLLRADETSFD